MLYLLLIFLIVYAVLILQLVRGWHRLSSTKTPYEQDHFISVVIAFRNEAQNITNLLDDLKKQNHPRYEVLLVDDYSTDGSSEIVNASNLDNLQFKLSMNEGTGKKQALTTGIHYAEGSIIVTTDADCRVGPNWLVEISKTFDDSQVMMASGGVTLQEDETFFSKLQALEFTSLIGSGAALIAVHKPTLCNGANLSFRKEAFERVGGYSGNLHIASGDDEFLMRKIDAVYKDSIRFIPESDAIVSTKASSSIASFFQQRFRWAGKWRYTSSWEGMLLAVYILLLQGSFIVAMGLLIFGEGVLFYTALAVLVIRMILEFSFLYPVCSFLKVRWRWSAFFFLQITYPFYVVFTGLFSNFMPTTWKDRKL